MKYNTINKSNLLSYHGNAYGTERIYKSILSESKKITASLQSYDIFLSHSHIDRDLIVAFKNMLEKSGLTVYVDWLVEEDRITGKVTAAEADKIRRRMKSCSRMIYLHTVNASDSKWCPWEIGYFDAAKSTVSVALISDVDSKKSTGQEYLDLYPRFFTNNYTNLSKYDFGIETDKEYNSYY